MARWYSDDEYDYLGYEYERHQEEMYDRHMEEEYEIHMAKMESCEVLGHADLKIADKIVTCYCGGLTLNKVKVFR